MSVSIKFFLKLLEISDYNKQKIVSHVLYKILREIDAIDYVDNNFKRLNATLILATINMFN